MRYSIPTEESWHFLSVGHRPIALFLDSWFYLIDLTVSIVIILWLVLRVGSESFFFFFFKIVLDILGPLKFRGNFRITSSVSTEKSASVLIAQISWGRSAIITMWTCSPRHDTSLSIFASFNSVLWFSEYKFCTSFLKFIPEYFILPDAVLSGSIFLTLFFLPYETRWVCLKIPRCAY